MKTLKVFLIVISLFLSGRIFAQGMMPPEPITSPVLTAMTGTWVSEPYQFMGSTMTDEVTQKMILNSQFMEIDIRSVGSNGFVYEATVIVAPGKDGTMTGWGFDIFGKDGMTTYTGTAKDNLVYMYGTSNWGTESRVIDINGNVMLQNVIMKMKDDKGNDMPEEKLTLSYNKKM